MYFARVIDRLSGCPLRSTLASLLSALILCVGVGGAVVGSPWAAPIFSAARSTDLASPPYSVAVGDLNNDGNLDVAVVHFSSSSTVTVLLGNGDGTFQTGVDYSTGPSPNCVRMGDLNNDGKLDLVTTSGSSATVWVLMGNGNGTFGTKVDYPTNPAPVSVAIGDLNGDGKADLAVGNLTVVSGLGTVSILLGNGDGTFQSSSPYATGNGNKSVAIKDLNADGKPDIVSANYLDGSASVLIGNGNGTFQPKVDYLTGASPYSVALDDVSGDGKPDIVTANGGSVSVLLGNGNGTFQAKLDQATGGVSVAIGDLNGDGKQDILTANGASTVAVILGNGSGTFQPPVDVGTGVGPNSVALGDTNGDGNLDILTANFSGAEKAVWVVLGRGDGTFRERLDYATAGSPTSVAVKDLNGDSKPDLVAANNNGSDVSVRLGNGDGTFQAKHEFPTGLYPSSVAIEDVDGDSRPDIVTTNFGAASVSFLKGKGDGGFETKIDYVTGNSPSSVTIADVTGDGTLDIVTANYADTTVSVLPGLGLGAFGPKQDLKVYPYPASIGIADVNGDSKLDLVVSHVNNVSTVNGLVAVYLGAGGGTFFAPTYYDVGKKPYSLALGDVSGDGKPDIVTANYDDNNVAVLTNKGDGSGTFYLTTYYTSGTNPYSVAIGELTGGGLMDIAVANSGANTVSVLESSFLPKVDYRAGDGPYGVAIADVNGDGNPDMVTANHTGNSVSVIRNLALPTTAISAMTMSTEATPDRVRIEWYVPGDRVALTSVYRRTVDSDWTLLGHPESDANQTIIYEDVAVSPGVRYGYRLVVRDVTGYETAIETWVSVPTGRGAPAVLRLESARPNPFGRQAEFWYGLPQAGRVRLAVYDVQGRRVASVVDRVDIAGWRSVVWGGRDQAGREVGSGTYFLRLESEGEVQVRKVVVAR